MHSVKLFLFSILLFSVVASGDSPGEHNSREIRDYSWNHVRKETLIRDEAPVWIPRHSVQIDRSAFQEKTAQPMMMPMAPVLQGSFAGNAVDDFDPPDPILSVGPNHIISVVNTTFGIYNKSGQRLFFHTLNNWFSPHLSEASGSALFDVKTIYDQYSGHFIIFCIAVNPHEKRSWFLFSASTTPDPFGDWVFHALDMQLNNQAHTALYADFPGVGYDQQAVYVTANMLDRQGNFQYAKIRVLKKSQIYSSSAVTWKDFWNLTDATGSKAINIMPASSFGTTPVEYLISTNAVRGDKLTLWTIHNAATNATISRRSIPVTSYQLPPSAPQKGGGAPINTGDAGVVNVVYSNGSLYAANAVSFDWGSGINSAMRFYQINSATGAVQQEITFGAAGLYYYYPAVMVDSRGNVVLVFNRSGATEFAGIRFSGRKVTDPAGKLQSAAVLKPGLANYQDPVLGDLNPWGDYNGIALDADDSVWIFSEFAKNHTDWATWVGHVRY